MKFLKLVRIAVLMAAQYGLVVANMRFIAVRHYVGTISTDAVIAANGMLLTKFAVNAETWPERIAYVVGGCMGSALALWMT